MRKHLLGAAFALACVTDAAIAQWSTVNEQFYLQAKHNWQFRKNYPGADRLFNAFDYGHAILYERLWTQPSAPVSVLEEQEYDFITQKLLANPPHVPVEEAAIEVEYAKLVPEAKTMFEWAHVLHRQLYDVLADERIPAADKDREVARLIAYYKTRPKVAFSSRPKTMELMEGQPYSTAFRREYPKFNGLIWAYHWLQVGLYEPLIVGRTKDERMTGVSAAVARFRQMIEEPPTWMPRVMPMTAAVAPEFAKRYPEASIIFDNLHSMHDVISDILANDSVPRNQKRAAILQAAARYRDDTSFVTTEAGWREMAVMMGVQNMGGPSVGLLSAMPTPTVARGATMASMDHAAHAAPARPNAPPDSAKIADFLMRLLMDETIRARIVADTATRRLMLDAIRGAPSEHRGHLESMLNMPVKPPAVDHSKHSTPSREQEAAAPLTTRAARKGKADGKRPSPRLSAK